MKDPLNELGLAISRLPDDAREAREHWQSAFRALLQDTSDPNEAFKAVFAARDATLAREVFERSPDLDWNRISARNPSVRVGTLIMERRYDMLRAFRDAGIKMGSSLHLLVQVAKKYDDPEPIRVLREDFGNTDLVWKKHDFAYHFEKCGPGLAPVLWEELHIHLNSMQGRAMRSFKQMPLSYLPLKSLAALLASGHDIRPLFRSLLETTHPHLRSLIEQTGSNHGQIALKALEPDPIAVIARPHNKKFYGLDPERMRIDFPEQ